MPQLKPQLNHIRRAAILVATLAFLIAPAAFADHPGMLDPTLIESAFGGTFTTSLDFNGDQIAAMIQSDDPAMVDVLDVLANVVAIRVRSASVAPDQASTVAEAFGNTAHDLKSQGWSTIVEVREQGQKQIDILLRNDEDIIRGVVVLFAGSDEAGFVNLAGDVSMAQVITIMQQVDMMSQVFVGMGEGDDES